MKDSGRRDAAERILRRVFRAAKPGLRWRLWDGSEGSVGTPDGTWTLVFRDPASFRALFGSKNSQVMGEAFIDDLIDVDGDLFAALRVANDLEDLEPSLLDKLAVGWLLRSV